MKPTIKPSNINFSSGPTSKRPGWTVDVLKNAFLGRSHRSAPGKAKLKAVIEESKALLNLPDDYLVGIMPGSDTGAIEAAMWNMLGERGLDILGWESFGKDWVIDVIEELKISDLNVYEADYGQLPDLSKVDSDRDVIFTWNGTTSGVRVPNGDWIKDDRKGLVFCDATSAIFSMPIDIKKCDIITWSWQKALGGEAAHGMLALSPRAVERLTSYSPSWPIPKVFRLTKKQKLIAGIFEGSTINTPSMLCVEDVLDSLHWVKELGGVEKLIERSNKSLSLIANWIAERDWVSFLCSEPENYSSTGITFKIVADWFANLDDEGQRKVVKEMVSLLANEEVAYDINGYAKAPASFRVWAGATIDPEEIAKLLPWIDWAYQEVKEKH